MKKINIWVAWVWTVGSEVIKSLQSNQEIIQNKVWAVLNVVWAYTRNPNGEKSREIYQPNTELFRWSIEELYNDPDIDILVETLWWLTLSKDFIEKALQNWKSVVTANKDLIATDWQRLLQIANQNWVSLKYEASVAWWIPIINAIQNGIAWDDIQEIRWIMNWTCNYMLTDLVKWWEYTQVLKKAQELWYAESDPKNDVEWIDTAYKLAILMSVWFGKNISLDQIQIDGINKLTSIEFKYAQMLEKKIKLLWVISKTRSKISAFVSPVLLDKDSKMAKTDWVLNAIEIIGQNATTFYSGPWAWGKATASAVVSDIVNISRFMQDGKYVWPSNMVAISNLELVEKQDVESKFYCRFHIKDGRWILSTITWVFAKYDINIDQVLQHNHTVEEKVNLPFVITLEKTTLANVKKAISEIDSYDFITEETFVMKILD